MANIETRQYENGDISLVKIVPEKYELEFFLSPSFDEIGRVIAGPFSPQDMVLTVFNLPGIRESKSHMVGGFQLDGDVITGYGGNEHDKLVVEDKEIADKLRFLIDPLNNVN